MAPVARSTRRSENASGGAWATARRPSRPAKSSLTIPVVRWVAVTVPRTESLTTSAELPAEPSGTATQTSVPTTASADAGLAPPSELFASGMAAVWRADRGSSRRTVRLALTTQTAPAPAAMSPGIGTETVAVARPVAGSTLDTESWWDERGSEPSPMPFETQTAPPPTATRPAAQPTADCHTTRPDEALMRSRRPVTVPPSVTHTLPSPAPRASGPRAWA